MSLSLRCISLFELPGSITLDVQYVLLFNDVVFLE